jgi:hypothetical protein
MRASRVVGALVLVVAVAVLAGAAQPATSTATTARGNAVTDWNEIAANATRAAYTSTSALVLDATVQAAVYDAVIAIEGSYEPFVASPAVPGPASPAAAVAAAAHDVLAARVPGQAASVDAQYAAYLAGIPDGPAKDNGITVGQEAAQAILAWRTGDGFENNPPYVQPPPARASSSLWLRRRR